MKKLILLIIMILFASVSFGDIITMPQYGPTDTLTSSNLNLRWNLLTNVMNGGIDGNNVDSDDGWRLLEVLADKPSAGNQGRVVFNKTDNTLNFDTGLIFLTSAILENTQEFTGVNTFSGDCVFTTISDLGTVTTVDLNGGTIDGTVIGGTTPAAGTFTTLTANTSITLSNTVTEFSTDGTMADNSDSAIPTEQAVVEYVGMTNTSYTSASPHTWTTTTNSGNISITKGKRYRAYVSINYLNGDDTIKMRFDSDSTGDNYAWGIDEIGFTAAASTITGDGADTEIELGTMNGAAGGDVFTAVIDIDATCVVAQASVFARIDVANSAGAKVSRQVIGHYTDITDLTDFEFVSSNNMTGQCILYEIE